MSGLNITGASIIAGSRRAAPRDTTPRGMRRCLDCGRNYKREPGDKLSTCYECLPIITVS